MKILRWKVLPGTFDVMIGKSSTEIVLTRPPPVESRDTEGRLEESRNRKRGPIRNTYSLKSVISVAWES